jgi:hypothetical protein
MGRKSGATFKFSKPFHRWKSALLREAIEEDGYLVLKVDGIPEGSGPTEQIYLSLESYDAAKVCKDWLKILLLSNDKHDRTVAIEAFDQIMKTRDEKSCPKCGFLWPFPEEHCPTQETEGGK